MIKNFTERKKKPHNYQIELKKNYDGTIEYVRAVKGIFLKKELGILGFIEGDNGYCKLEFFRVRETERGKGIGRNLLEIGIEELRKHGYAEIIVYPKSEPYDGEGCIEPMELYKIYQQLGFCFTEKDVDRTRNNNEMKRSIINA